MVARAIPIFFVVLAAGCARPLPESEVFAILGESSDGTKSARGGGRNLGFSSTFDLGPVIAAGQILKHDFELVNRLDHPIRVVSATALTPCCSAVGAISKEAIGPGQSLVIPVSLKAVPITKPERKRVQFVIESDDREHATFQYVLSASFYPEFEIRPLGGPRVLRSGKPGRWEFEAVARRVGAGEAILPDRVKAESPLIARFSGESRRQADPDGLVAVTRTIEILAPASTELGSHVTSVVFQGGADGERRHLIVWSVEPALRVTPKSLVLKRDERGVSQTLVVHSADRPIRILGVEPADLLSRVEFGKDPKTAQSIRLTVDRDRARDREFTLTIRTDHPDQPTLSLRIMFLPEGV